MGSQGMKIAFQVLLVVVIVGLAYWLYRSITDPYEAIQREQAITEATRNQMAHVRTALVRYERQQDVFPGSLDSLMLWIPFR